ncbi:unnamed protein product [Dovyalis caffra]|uniref:DUF4219 domain-containing protein n=1 Tax=Dovyalis caffra TaxID=77055 RepID=A0AAV1RKC8_9ROSI|nr:unnamed protein product [Dovyalis caffra]
MELGNGGSSSSTQNGVEKLVGTNYRYWRMCMEAYLQELDSDEKIGEARPRRTSNSHSLIIQLIRVMKEGIAKIDDDAKGSDIKLNDVYRVLGLKRNLVSVSQITDSRKYVLFGSNDVKVLDNVNQITSDVVVVNKKKGSLFVKSAGEERLEVYGPETKRFVTSQDVVFDEVLTLHSREKFSIENVILDDDQDNLMELFPRKHYRGISRH